MSESIGDAIVSQAAATQNPTAPETTAEAVPEGIKSDESTKRLAFFAKKEKALLEKEAKFKQAYEEKMRGLELEYKPVKEKSELLKRLESKDYDALKELGYDYNEWTNRLVNDGTPSHEFVMEQKLQQLESKLEQRFKEKEQEFTTKAEEIKTQQQQQAEKRMQIDIREFLSTDSSSADPKYQLLNAQEKPAEETVFEVIDQHYKKTLEDTGIGRVLKYEEAAALAEKYFESKIEELFTKTPKVKAMFEKLYGAPKPPEPTLAPPQRPARSLDTLSPTMAAPTEPPRPKSKGYDREEVLKEAIRMVEQTRAQQK